MISPALIGFTAAGMTVAATITTQSIDGAGTSQNQLLILLSSIVSLVILVVTNVFLIMNEKRKRRWAEEDQKRQEERERRAEEARKEIKQDVKAVGNVAQTVQTELARNTEITKQAAQAVTDGNSVAKSLRQAFDAHFAQNKPTTNDEHKPAG